MKVLFVLTLIFAAVSGFAKPTDSVTEADSADAQCNDCHNKEARNVPHSEEAPGAQVEKARAKVRQAFGSKGAPGDNSTDSTH